METHELTFIENEDRDNRYIGGRLGYADDFYLCTCGEKFQANGDVLAAFEHGQEHPKESVDDLHLDEMRAVVAGTVAG